MIVNYLKILFGHVVIALVYYPWRITEKVSGKSLGACTKAHYYIMVIFRFLFKIFLVTIKYKNPVQREHVIKLKVDLCQNSPQWYFRLRGKYELDMIEMIAYSMKSANTFLDIGSNIGVFAVTIAQAFPANKIIAVEPLKENFIHLKENMVLNSINNIEIYNAVVSNSESGRVIFYPNPIHDGGGSMIKSTFYRTGDVFVNADQYQETNVSFSPEIEIKSIKLDDIVKSKSVVKIDVEGAEVSVLESGKNIFRQGLVDMVIVEVLNETIDEATTFLDDCGFDCFTKDINIPVKVGTRLGRYVGNIICLRRESFEHRFLKEKYFQLPEINS